MSKVITPDTTPAELSVWLGINEDLCEDFIIMDCRNHEIDYVVSLDLDTGVASRYIKNMHGEILCNVVDGKPTPLLSVFNLTYFALKGPRGWSREFEF